MRNKNAKVSDPNSFITDPGEKFKIEYSPKVLPDGTIELKESGKINIDEYINAQRDQTDMAYILKQLAIGNTSVLQQGSGMFGDFTDPDLPKTYAEALQLQIDAAKSFYQLPVDVRAKFDNDFNRYFASAGTDDWFYKLGIKNNAEKEEESTPVADDISSSDRA